MNTDWETIYTIDILTFRKFKPIKENFLTPVFKKKILKNLSGLIKKENIDKGFIPWLDKINSIPSIVTVFSCEGHKANYPYFGILVDKVTHNKLLKKAHLTNNIFNIHCDWINTFKKADRKNIPSANKIRWFFHFKKLSDIDTILKWIKE